MPRPRRDGSPTASANRRKLNDLYLKKLKPQERAFIIWDAYQRGLAIAVQPSGHKSWKCIYSFRGRPRWFHIGDAAAIDLSDARKLASRVMFQVAEGKDPAAERNAERGKGVFEDLATRYVEEYAKRKNRSWKQADALVRKHLLPSAPGNARRGTTSGSARRWRSVAIERERATARRSLKQFVYGMPAVKSEAWGI
jgi:Arm DNA-binding domain